MLGRRKALALLLSTPAALAGESAAAQRPTEPSIAARFVSAMESRDLARISTLLDDSVVVELPFDASGRTDAAAARVFTGKTAALGYYQGAFGRLSEIRFVDVVVTTSRNGRRQFIEARGEMVVAATSTPYRNLYVFCLDIDARGRVVALREIFNPVTAALAFGRPIGPQRQAP